MRQARQQAAYMRRHRAMMKARAAKMRALRAKRMAIARAAKLRGAKKADPACTTCGAASNLTVKQTTVVNAAQTKAKAK